MWRCTACGYIHEGDEAPERCPKCNAPREKFEAVAEAAAELIRRSRQTNGLHIKLSALLAEVMCVSEQGIEDNLDPPCVKIFTEAREQAAVLRRKINAEIQGHISKGKWG